MPATRSCKPLRDMLLMAVSLFVSIAVVGGCRWSKGIDDGGMQQGEVSLTDGVDRHDDSRVESATTPSSGNAGSAVHAVRADGMFDNRWMFASYVLDGEVLDVGEWRSDSEGGEFPWITPGPPEAQIGSITITLAISDVLKEITPSVAYSDVNGLDRYIVAAAWEQFGPHERAFVQTLEQGDRVFAFVTENPAVLYSSHPPETVLDDVYFSPVMQSLRETVERLETGGYDVGYGNYLELFRVDGDEVHSAFVGSERADPVLSRSAFVNMLAAAQIE